MNSVRLVETNGNVNQTNFFLTNSIDILLDGVELDRDREVIIQSTFKHFLQHSLQVLHKRKLWRTLTRAHERQLDRVLKREAETHVIPWNAEKIKGGS